MTINIPTLICAISISTYWLIVFVKAIIITPKIGKTPNVIPKEATGYLSRMVMLPLLACWIVSPWKLSFSAELPSYFSLAWLGAIGCVIGLVLTIYCWYYMGSAWRIGIDPKEKNELLIDGPFKQIRHPIYALSIFLMFSSFLATQTTLMFILFCVHGLLFSLETYREERYLSKVHGESYTNYMAQTNRFLPSFRNKHNA